MPFRRIREFLSRYPAIRGTLKDVALALAGLIVICAALYAYAGVWPPLASVTSDSMFPHLEKGDLVFIQGLGRGDVKTYEGPESVGYGSFGETGDVIVYRPNGQANVTPIIHRAIRFVAEGQPMWHNGPPAPWAGYITLGDNNQGTYDQNSNISPEAPVRKEWIIGIARYRIPYVGYVRGLVPY